MGATWEQWPGTDMGLGPGRADRTTARATAGPRRPPVPVELTAFRSADFVYDTTSLENLQRLIDTVPAGPRGTRWIHMPDAVLCHAEYELDAPYDDFVSRVDIATVGRRFENVLSSATEVLRRHRTGRVTLQLERVTVRPQLNQPAFPSRDNPDIYWLEKIDYGLDEQRIWIRTVHRPYGSTGHYDGYLAFARAAKRTRLAFLACRRFSTPRLLTPVHLDWWPWLTRVLAESACRRFLDVTTANIVASYHGRDVRAGAPPSPADSTAWW